eukprot:ctg_122.g59
MDGRAERRIAERLGWPGRCHPRNPPPTIHMSKLVYSAYCGNRKAAVLCVAVELGLFGVVDALHREGQATAERLRSALELSPRGADALFLALQRMGLLTFNEKSANTP